MAEAIHDFTAKLRQPQVLPDVVRAVRAHEAGQPAGTGPLSINLDLTTACNYGCEHCIDLEILNHGRPYQLPVVLDSLDALHADGLRSVILIGGGEPTLHPDFEAVVRHLKGLNLQCAIVSNGSRNDRLSSVAAVLARPDWVRLSLDAGTDETFQIMHRPRRPITLGQICDGVAAIKNANPDLPVGFSFIISWADPLHVYGPAIQENVHEIALATQLAKDSGFDYISLKPLLRRDPGGHESVRFPAGAAGARLRERIAAELARARALADGRFAVVGSTNLAALADSAALRTQPHRCYLHLLRQVLTPHGVFGCPAYRGDPRDRLGPADAYASAEGRTALAATVARLPESFDPSVECSSISCIYSATNWWLDALAGGEAAAVAADTGTDLFL